MAYYSENKKKTRKKGKIKSVIITILVAVVLLIIIGLGYINSKVPLWDIVRVRFFSSKKVVVLDPGHGGKDPGCGNDIYEKEVVLNILKDTAKSLKLAGYEVVITRDDDTFVDLSGRIIKSRMYHADMFVSVHLNWSDNRDAYGVETYCNKGLNSESEKLANAVHRGVLKNVKSLDRKVRTDSDYYVVRNSSVPSIIVEVGFLSSKKEGDKLKKKTYQNTISKGIVDGIIDYSGKK